MFVTICSVCVCVCYQLHTQTPDQIVTQNVIRDVCRLKMNHRMLEVMWIQEALDCSISTVQLFNLSSRWPTGGAKAPLCR